MKQITITIPDNCELKQEGDNYTIVKKVEKEKKLTYEDAAKEMFLNKPFWYIEKNGDIVSAYPPSYESFLDANNCTSEKQAEKLLAINKLMNVAKYLNGDWQHDWRNMREDKVYFSIYCNEIRLSQTSLTNDGNVYFKSRKLAQDALIILGEETIRLALSSDY